MEHSEPSRAGRPVEGIHLRPGATNCGKGPLAVAAIKEQLRILADADPITPEAFERIQQLRHDVYRSADYQEGLTAFREAQARVYRALRRSELPM